MNYVGTLFFHYEAFFEYLYQSNNAEKSSMIIAVDTFY